MGFFDSMMSAANDALKRQYRSATGKDYDRDFRNFICEYEWKDDYYIKSEWKKLENDTSIRSHAKKQAIIDIMKQRDMWNSRDDF